MQKRETIFVYLPNTSHFMHFQSVRQKKGNIHHTTNKYRWHFLSKLHQTTSLKYFSPAFLILRKKQDSLYADNHMFVVLVAETPSEAAQILSYFTCDVSDFLFLHKHSVELL